MLTLSSLEDPNRFDAGDMVGVVISVNHRGVLASRHTDAFRVLLVVSYPTKYLQLNTSSFGLDISGLQYPSDSIVYDTAAGVVMYNVSELGRADQMLASMDFKLLNEVYSTQTITLGLELFWHSLPYALDGGRNYNLSGTHSVSYTITT